MKVPVIDHWWQTETGWCIAGNPVGLGLLPVKHGSPTVPMPGYQVDVVDEAAKPVGPNTMGSIVIKLPMPPGCLPTLWNQDERFKESYLSEFPGYYKTSDAGYKDGTDMSSSWAAPTTSSMSPAIVSHRRHGGDSGLTSRCRGMCRARRQGCDQGRGALRFPGAQGRREACARRDREGDRRTGARQARPRRGLQARITVGRLPKTRSGKILRGTIKKIADGETWTMPATIEDPKALDEIGDALKGRV